MHFALKEMDRNTKSFRERKKVPTRFQAKVLAFGKRTAYNEIIAPFT